jgi:hypothetical protein
MPGAQLNMNCELTNLPIRNCNGYANTINTIFRLGFAYKHFAAVFYGANVDINEKLGDIHAQ